MQRAWNNATRTPEAIRHSGHSGYYSDCTDARDAASIRCTLKRLAIAENWTVMMIMSRAGRTADLL